MTDVTDMIVSPIAIAELTAIAERGAEALLAALLERYHGRVTLASSLGAEDQVLTHMLLAIEPRARIFVLDTGRLHQETYDLMARTMSRYGMRYEVLFPDAAAVQEMVGSEGPNLFYASVAGRKRCCEVRKVEPLGRALAGADAWITGLRRAQSPERADTPALEWDAAHAAVKANPLADWSDEQVWDYLRVHEVPYNVLHDRGFLSIGCAPCTRAVAAGEPARAGRWWWEQGTAKECGLHPAEGHFAADAVPDGAAPGDAAPGDAVPGDAAPGDAVPADAVPADAGADAVPADAAPADAVPADAAPARTAGRTASRGGALRHRRRACSGRGDGAAGAGGARAMTALQRLEAQSVYILREAYREFPRLCMLWSIGKDSTVLLWLTRKAFFGEVPFPLVHIDTSFKIPEMIAYRDRLVRDWRLNLIYGENRAALDAKHTFPAGAISRIACCKALKTDALVNTLSGAWPRYRYDHDRQRYLQDTNTEPYTGVIVGARADEEGSRSKERYFSPRDHHSDWDIGDQPPELWNQFKTDFAPGTHVRVHPLLDWTELNIWEYIEAEEIPVVPLYFDHGDGTRYRSLGCYPCTTPVQSNAATVAEIVAELRTGQFAHIAERAGREQDKEGGGTLETLRREGYM